MQQTVYFLCVSPVGVSIHCGGDCHNFKEEGADEWKAVKITMRCRAQHSGCADRFCDIKSEIAPALHKQVTWLQYAYLSIQIDLS